MLSPLKVLACVVPLIAASAAAAETGERCANVLCNLYKSASQPAQGTAATPGTTSSRGIFGMFSKGDTDRSKPKPDVSGTPASKSSYWSEVQGGPLSAVGLDTPSKCTDKLCNLYYGDGASIDPDQAPVAQQPSFDPNVPTTFADADDAATGVAVVEARPSCAASPRDPWRCYRR